MKTLGIVTGVGALGSGHTLMARILGNAGTPITQATLSGITYTIRDLTAQTTVASAQALTVSSVVYDSLQQEDPRWDLDAAGYNFLAVIPASWFTDYDVDEDTGVVTSHRYQVDVEFTPVSGQPFVQSFQFQAVANYA